MIDFVGVFDLFGGHIVRCAHALIGLGEGVGGGGLIEEPGEAEVG